MRALQALPDGQVDPVDPGVQADPQRHLDPLDPLARLRVLQSAPVDRAAQVGEVLAAPADPAARGDAGLVVLADRRPGPKVNPSPRRQRLR